MRLIREVALIVLAIIIINKVLDAKLNFDFSKLSATDLVALLLATFSIALSAAFYFAATNSSAKFYDNMHNFTKDTSVILGQLTERLNSVDKGQDEVKNRFDKLYENGSSAKNLEAMEKEKEKKESVDKSRDEFNETIEKLINKIQVDPQEKEKIIKDITQKEEKLSSSLEKLSEYKLTNKMAAKERVRLHTKSIIKQMLKKKFIPFELLINDLLFSHLGSEYHLELFEVGYIDSQFSVRFDDLTDEGYKFFSKIFQSLVVS